MAKNDGGPAFPAGVMMENQRTKTLEPCIVSGMSLRDYIAVHAPFQNIVIYDLESAPNELAEWAYRYADAMIAEREK